MEYALFNVKFPIVAIQLRNGPPNKPRYVRYYEQNYKAVKNEKGEIIVTECK